MLFLEVTEGALEEENIKFEDFFDDDETPEDTQQTKQIQDLRIANSNDNKSGSCNPNDDGGGSSSGSGGGGGGGGGGDGDAKTKTNESCESIHNNTNLESTTRKKPEDVEAIFDEWVTISKEPENLQEHSETIGIIQEEEEVDELSIG
jgi:hypothetical protein